MCTCMNNFRSEFPLQTPDIKFETIPAKSLKQIDKNTRRYSHIATILKFRTMCSVRCKNVDYILGKQTANLHLGRVKIRNKTIKTPKIWLHGIIRN